MIIGSKNKGDWSELYALLYLLGTRKLYTADEKLQQIQDLYFPIIKIMRQENSTTHIDFVLDGVNTVEIYLNSLLARTMTSDEFMDEANLLRRDISEGSGSFDIPHGEEFLNGIYCQKLAATSQEVTDIKMELHDAITGTDQVMGFSIKSYLGGAPTLFNASGATNFKYSVDGLNDQQMEEINAIETRTKILDRIRKIYDFDGSISCLKAVNEVFSANLMMIDSCMEEIISEMLLFSYSSNETDCKKLIEHLEETNPINYPRQGFYEYKFKKFLCAKALGLDPSKEWNGIDDANGGYIVVKSNGEVLTYHIYNRDKFEQYLYDSTYLDRGSTSKHGYASLYKEGEKMYINLNLQIRFKKDA